MKSPLVTVFIPVYNCETYIADSLESILNQTYKNLEVLLVNDGSTDNSVGVIKKYNDSRIRIVNNEENRGIPYTRNVGLREATGEYLVIMDSDDISLPDRIEKQVKHLEANPSLDVVGSNYIKFNDKSERKISSSLKTPEEVKAMLLFFSPLSNPSSAVRMKTVRDNNLTYNEEFFVAQDYDFWAQLSKKGNLAVLPDFLLKYRSGHENITKTSKRDKVEKRKKIINAIHEDLLAFYGIDLTAKEKQVYNEFFSQNFSAIQEVSVIESMIRKLKSWNEDSDAFNKEVFLKVLDDAFLAGLSNQQISIKDKVKLYLSLKENKNGKELLFLVAKHVYYKKKL